MEETTITLKKVPGDLHRSLKESAQRNKRSLNKEVLHRLENSLQGDLARRHRLAKPPVARSVGRVLVPQEALNARSDALLDRKG